MNAEAPTQNVSLPLVVALNDDRKTAVLRPVLAALTLVGFGGPSALAAAEWLAGPPAVWKVYDSLILASFGMIACVLFGSLWMALLPRRWTIGEQEIVYVGPIGRQAVLRWGEVRRVRFTTRKLVLQGQPGSGSIVVLLYRARPGQACDISAALRERLDPYFVFPEPEESSWKAWAWVIAYIILVIVPGFVWMHEFRRLARRHGVENVPWMHWVIQQGWLRNLARSNEEAAAFVLTMWAFAPWLLWWTLVPLMFAQAQRRRERILRRDRVEGLAHLGHVEADGSGER